MSVHFLEVLSKLGAYSMMQEHLELLYDHLLAKRDVDMFYDRHLSKLLRVIKWSKNAILIDNTKAMN